MKWPWQMKSPERMMFDRLLRERDDAEAAGYRRGVEDAAKAVKDNQGVYKTKTAEAALEFAWLDVRVHKV